MAPEIPKGKEAEFEKFKVEGYVNPDGSSYDPKTEMFIRSPMDPALVKKNPTDPDVAKTYKVTLVDAFNARQEGYKKMYDPEKAAAEAARDKAAKDAVTTAGGEIAKAHSIVELDALKNKLGTNMTSLGETFSLENSKITGGFVFKKGSEFTGAVDGMRDGFGKLFTPEKVAAATKILNANLQPNEAQYKEVEVANLMTNLYTNAAVKSLQNSFTTTYKNYVGFRDGLTPEKTYNFTYDLAIDKNSVFNCTVKPDPDPSNTFLVEYTSYDKMNKLPVELTPSEVKLNERAKAFKSSGVGRFLSAMGVINVGVAVEGETQAAAEARETKAYAEALNGNNFIAQFFIYFMGGSAMLADGGAAVSEAISGLDPKFQAVVKSIDAKVPKMMAKMAADPKYMTPADELEAARTEPVKAEDFGKILSGEKAQPEKTMKLSEKYNTGDKGLTITLKDGAEMIIPEGTSIRIKGKSEPEKAEDKKPRSFTSTITVTGELPVGTKFNSKVVFEKPGDKAATAKKEDDKKTDAAKPAPDTNEKPAS
ncbi:MAG: hypothetical protein NTZ25_06035 [Candidatus Peregrinibacteria bacterium]|nr:hypothetical protein [Candidatus Peregrinibacteria bacterium]